MPKILKKEKFHVGLFDSDTGESLRPSKVVDITNLCKHDKGCKIIFVFARAKRGRIVKIIDAYPGENYGSWTHFFVDELKKEMGAKPKKNAFGKWAERLGMTKKHLKRLIESFVPGEKIVFRPKSSWQKDDCINQSCEFKCRRKSTLEAVAGNAQIRCCDKPRCKRRAAEMVELALIVFP